MPSPVRLEYSTSINSVRKLSGSTASIVCARQIIRASLGKRREDRSREPKANVKNRERRVLQQRRSAVIGEKDAALRAATPGQRVRQPRACMTSSLRQSSLPRSSPEGGRQSQPSVFQNRRTNHATEKKRAPALLPSTPSGSDEPDRPMSLELKRRIGS